MYNLYIVFCKVNWSKLGKNSNYFMITKEIRLILKCTIQFTSLLMEITKWLKLVTPRIPLNMFVMLYISNATPRLCTYILTLIYAHIIRYLQVEQHFHWPTNSSNTDSYAGSATSYLAVQRFISNKISF